MVAFFSPFAADLVAGAWHKRPGNKGEFRVASLSLTQFEAASLATKQKDDALTKAYVPDPAQIPAVVGLQLQQGAKPKQARTLAQSQPYGFCPDPLVRITQTEAGKSTTAVPCALIAKSPTVLKAYSLSEMVQIFSEQSGDDARNLVIASPIASPAPDSTPKVSAFSP